VTVTIGAKHEPEPAKAAARDLAAHAAHSGDRMQRGLATVGTTG
jgi:hypothetical protein